MIKRIIQIREQAGLSQEKFAEKIGLSRNFINQAENGKKNFSDRTLKDICREFNVNEAWLRTGDGEPYKKRTRNQELAVFVNDVMEEMDESFRKRFILALSKLNESDWETIEKIANELHKAD